MNHAFPINPPVPTASEVDHALLLQGNSTDDTRCSHGEAVGDGAALGGADDDGRGWAAGGLVVIAAAAAAAVAAAVVTTGSLVSVAVASIAVSVVSIAVAVAVVSVAVSIVSIVSIAVAVAVSVVSVAVSVVAIAIAVVTVSIAVVSIAIAIAIAIAISIAVVTIVAGVSRVGSLARGVDGLDGSLVRELERLGDGAGAVRDGQGGRLRNSVRLGADAHGRRLRAVGGISRDNLGHHHGSRVRHGGLPESNASEDGSDNDLELHLDWGRGVVLFVEEKINRVVKGVGGGVEGVCVCVCVCV